jgi:hypothetical protein
MQEFRAGCVNDIKKLVKLYGGLNQGQVNLKGWHLNGLPLWSVHLFIN